MWLILKFLKEIFMMMHLSQTSFSGKLTPGVIYKQVDYLWFPPMSNDYITLSDNFEWSYLSHFFHHFLWFPCTTPCNINFFLRLNVYLWPFQPRFLIPPFTHFPYVLLILPPVSSKFLSLTQSYMKNSSDIIILFLPVSPLVSPMSKFQPRTPFPPPSKSVIIIYTTTYHSENYFNEKRNFISVLFHMPPNLSLCLYISMETGRVSEAGFTYGTLKTWQETSICNLG